MSSFQGPLVGEGDSGFSTFSCSLCSLRSWAFSNHPSFWAPEVFISSKLHTVRFRQGEKHILFGKTGKEGHDLGKERPQKADMVLRQLRVRERSRK